MSEEFDTDKALVIKPNGKMVQGKSIVGAINGVKDSRLEDELVFYYQGDFSLSQLVEIRNWMFTALSKEIVKHEGGGKYTLKRANKELREQLREEKF